MFFLALLFYIYCIIGGVIGLHCYLSEKWPKYTEDDYMDGGPTVLFFLFCGPIFWVGLLLFVTFRGVINILK